MILIQPCKLSWKEYRMILRKQFLFPGTWSHRSSHISGRHSNVGPQFYQKCSKKMLETSWELEAAGGNKLHAHLTKCSKTPISPQKKDMWCLCRWAPGMYTVRITCRIWDPRTRMAGRSGEGLTKNPGSKSGEELWMVDCYMAVYILYIYIYHWYIPPPRAKKNTHS